MTELIISGGLDDDEPEDRADSGPDVELRQLSFGPAQHGQRLDRALVELVPEFSRSYLQQLIDLEGVTLNGIVMTKPSTRVRAADVGMIELRPTPQSQAFKPEAMALSVVYEDEHLLVINKPAGLVVHPAPGNWSGTLLNGLLAYDARAMNLPRAGIVHRLDKDTSGLMVVARTRPVMDALIRSIAAREVSRQYVALAHGPWVANRRIEIDAPIGRDPRNRLRMAAVDLFKNPGKLARTDVGLLQNCDQGCWVRCTLHTGRTHQIRVHMAMIGHPLVADVLYGGRVVAGMQRQALHACRLGFAHPVTLEPMVFQASLPVDLELALVNWGLRYNQT
ncbi:MAG: RluA family pseudouridine synthase [Rhodoferax sp.]|uniref:RluA family pseudouridine synthase n=1 Tax=Rhodoferax sp. TaxID=50421 RepID=UPI0014005286|nr:RluA family pseudouridine synthase [Rhodoferax sp.]NDP37773.1 RluA family pseudouridine synthase [Rhodoferax sp.]